MGIEYYIVTAAINRRRLEADLAAANLSPEERQQRRNEYWERVRKNMNEADNPNYWEAIRRTKWQDNNIIEGECTRVRAHNAGPTQTVAQLGFCPAETVSDESSSGGSQGVAECLSGGPRQESDGSQCSGVSGDAGSSEESDSDAFGG